MTSREADGSDKIAAFERGISDARAALAFESPAVYAYIINDTFLVAYAIDGPVLVEKVRMKLYDNGGTLHDVHDFLNREAATFDCLAIDSLTIA